MNKHPEPLFQKRNFPPPGMINFVNIFITPPKTFQFDLGVAGNEILTLSALYRSCQFLPLSDRTIRVHLQVPFREVPITPEMAAYNQSISAVRVSVEWIFGDVINYFKFMDFKKNLKIGLSQVGKMYIVSAILRNGLTCLYGNTTSKFFELEPPSLQKYFS